MKEGICIYYGNRTVFIPYDEVATIVWGKGIVSDDEYAIVIYRKCGGNEYIRGDDAKVEAEANRLSAWLHMGRGVYDIHVGEGG